MKIYNSLTNTIEEFKTAGQAVTFYVCGPTVYDYAHIGNLRTYIFEDMLRRVLKINGYKIKQVMNITDVDDKTIKKGEGKRDKHEEITAKYEKLFWQDLSAINVEKPDIVTKATGYIPQMLSLVDDLLKKGYAYKANDGSIYFSISKFKDYGKLSKLDRSGLKSGARVAQDDYSKENPSDFALWKAWDESDGEIFWEPSDYLGTNTVIEKGRPGWHIECSAMSQAELGETIDIHAGGIDLKFPHHENEIAQSEASTGKKFARYWVHGEHLLVDNQKMSKSLNNFYKLSDIVERGYDPLDFRYLCISSHYRSKLNFTWQALDGAKNARNRLKRIAEDLVADKDAHSTLANKYLDEFNSKISDDLNTPEAIATMWEMLRDDKIGDADKAYMLRRIDKEFLAIGIYDKNEQEIPSLVVDLAKKRDEAKKSKNYQLADEIRLQIKDIGYNVEDSSEGYKIVKI